MMYNLKNSLTKTNKQTITYIVLSSMLVMSAVLLISISQVANAATPSIAGGTFTYIDADGDAGDTDTHATKTRQKTVTAPPDSANNSGTTWRNKVIAGNADCDQTQMSSGAIRSGNDLQMSAESYNGRKICFEATNGGNRDYAATMVIGDQDGDGTFEGTGDDRGYGIDRTRPDAPTTIALDTLDDTGVSSTDGITSTTEDLTITGCAETDSEVELLLDGQSFTPKEVVTATGTAAACTATNTSPFTFDINLAPRSRTYVITAKTTDGAGNESPESRQRKEITVDTTPPTVALTYELRGGVQGEKSGESDITYLSTDDTVTIRMAFTEANGMSADTANQPIITFYNDTSAITSATYTATGTGNTRTVIYTVGTTESIANGDLKYDITNETSIRDRAGNELATQDPQTITDTIIDTTKPTVSSITFATTNENTTWAAESDEITTTVTFSEGISERTQNTGIFYRLGTSGAGQRFSFTTGRSVGSGQCQETTTANRYECKYTVKSGDAGEFQVSVSKFTDYAGNAGDKTDFAGTITTDTSVTAPSAITLSRGIKERDNEITPSFIVTVGETGGEVILYSDSECSAEISTPILVTDTRTPFTIEVTTDDYEDDGSEDGPKTVYATHEDEAGNISDCSTAYGSYTFDTSPPTVEEGATGYYSDATTTKEIPLDDDGRGKVSAGSNIYTKVVFDEEVKYRPGSSSSALPEIKYSIGENEYRYRIVSNASTLSGGRCKPTAADNISDTYICQYRVKSSDVGIFTLIVDERTEDLLEHTLEETYTHADSILLDNTPPAKPSALDLHTDDDSGNITNDNITNKTTGITIEGCAETDSTVQLYANGTIIKDATGIADDSGYTCANETDDGFSIDITLAAGVHRITAKATDSSNNISAASDAVSVTVDTTAPTATVTGTPTGTTNVGTLDVTVGGADVTHYQYALFSGESCVDASYSNGDTDGTEVATKITESTPNQDGSIILCVVGRDTAGNWQAKADATTATWTRDTTNPTKPTGLTLDETDDTGLLATDGITKKTTDLTITGCAEEGSTIEILEGGSSFSTKVTGVADTTDTACTRGTKRFSADIALTEGDKVYAISATATDPSENVSAESDILNIEIKSTAPSITATNLDLATDDDSGTNTSDNITNKKTDLTISGDLSGAPSTGDYVQLYDGTKILTDAKDSSFTGTDNSWSIDIDLSEEGLHTINAKILDAAGNEGTATSIAITIDTTGPTVSVTQHIASPTTDATPDINIRTSAAGVVSFGGACTDTSESPTVQNVTAGENTVTLPTLENKTYSDCTVMVRDETGNLSDGAKINTFIVDNTPPTITGAAANNAARTETKITLNEQVYAPTTPSSSDFRIEIDGITYADLVTGISGVAQTKAAASQSFILRHSALPAGNVGVKYIKGTNHIFDQIGNTLESISTSVSISATQFISITLHADDDTGSDNTDGLTQFDGNEVTLTVSLNTGTFANGDRVRIFMGNGNTAVASYTISNSIVGSRYINAGGEASFDITLPKSRFSIGVNTMSATYTKVGSIEGGRGEATTITYDNTAPTITVQNPNANPAVQKEVRATDNESGTTTWEYKVLTEAVQVCGVATMNAGTDDYTEGNAIIFKDTTDNGNRVCFSATDAAGNIAYADSDTLRGIDSSAPTIESAVTTSTDRRTVRVTVSERVYATTTPAPSDFKVVVGNSEYPVISITGLATDTKDAKNDFTITLPSFPSNTQMTLKYTAGTNTITDLIGNRLENFSGQAISNMKLISLDLNATDDTGSDTTDNITHFDGDIVTLTISLNEGVFGNGDRVHLFAGDSTTPAQIYTISDLAIATTYKDANGEASFTADLPRSMFSVGVNNLSATYTPSGGDESTRGGILAITYDNTAPTITVQNPNANPAVQKEVRATDNESGTTTWEYKVLTEAVQVCGVATMNAGTDDYTEGNAIIFKDTTDNGNRVCFSATDAAGNIAYADSDTLRGIDSSAPTIESAVTTSTDRRTVRVTVSERVYATTTPAPSDFKVVVGNSEYPVISITGLATDTKDAKNDFTITLPSFPSNTQMTLKYTAGTNTITDLIGNRLENFSGQAISNMKLISLDLNATDDTGSDTTDNITHFDGDIVTLTISLNEGVFGNGDRVHLFAGDSTTPAQIYTISDLAIATTYKDANGEASFTADLPRSMFSVGVNNLSATYTPSGGDESTRGGILAITYDNTAPTITVQNPDSTKEQRKVVSARDNDSATTVWQYKQIAGNITCNATAMTNATAYSEGATTIAPNSESDNGTKMCFSSTDIAGNSSYKESDQIRGVDVTAPTVTSASITTIARTTTKVSLSEPIYATANVNPNDFRIISGQTQYIVTGITGLTNDSNTAETSFTLTHVPLGETESVNLQYTRGTTSITDLAGNVLQNFTEAVSNKPFITLTLDPQDDTGTSNTDGITRFDGNEVSITVTLTSGVFRNGDQIHLYEREETSSLKRIIVASAGANTVNANGATSFTTTVTKQQFTEGEVTLYATYIPAGQITATNGVDFSFTYDNTAPSITVTNPTATIATEKQVSATDNETDATTWMYKIIGHNTSCDRTALSGDANSYTEGSTIDITSNDSNEKKVCFSSTDVAGNSAYAESDTLQGIDSVDPTVSSAVFENYDRTRTVITFSEKVYASRNFSPSEFSIEIGDTGYNHRVSDIENLPTTSSSARKTIVLIHPTASNEIESRITYTPGTETVQDIAGNTLKGFTKGIENTSFITLDLADEDDTGSDKNDNYTRLEGSMVTLTVKLTNNAIFSNSDVVTIYKERDDRTRTAVKKLTISTFPAQDAVNAHGDNSFTVEIPKSVFDENATTTLSAGYAPFGNTDLHKTGNILQVTVDTSAPTITITEASDGPSAQKTISATGEDATETVWQYIQIQSGVVCNADIIETGKEYTKGTTISLNSETDNDTKICFSATDLAGNTTYKSSEIITGIDTEAPTVQSVSVTGEDELTVSMSEPVHATRNPNPDDFVVFINNSPVTTATIIGIPNTAGRAEDEFVIVVADTIRADDAVSLSYIGSSRSNDNELIKDIIGNTLTAFDNITATLPSVLTIKLDPTDDTGADTTDGITRLGDDSEVKIIATLNNDTFKDGDQVRIYKNNESRAIASVVVGIRGNEVNARGETSLTLTVDKSQFTEGQLTLHATYRPRLEREGLPSALLSITYDATAPSIRITNPNRQFERSKNISAVDGDTAETTWTYKQIADGTGCNTEEMSSGTESYTEGTNITLDEEDDNYTRVCFSVSDIAGNTSYALSRVVREIDTIGSTITVTNPTDAPARSKTVKAADDERTTADWMYKQIAGDSTCGAEEMSNGAQVYTEGAEIVLNEEDDNGTKVCFSVTDTIGNTSYSASVVISGIDSTAPVITVHNPNTDPAQEKTVRATDTDTEATTWTYKQITGNETCNATQMSSDTQPYTEGEDITFNDESDNNTKVCFSATDSTGNMSHKESAPLSGIDQVGATISVSNPTTDPEQEKVIRATDADTETTTWAYKQIEGNTGCDAGQMSSDTESYAEGTDIIFDEESDNGTKVCFSVTDTVGNTTYRASRAVQGIDTTAPSITVHNPDTSSSTSKVISAEDADTTTTLWRYAQVDANGSCEEIVSASQTRLSPYTEGADLTFDEESDNGTKVCFFVFDLATNIAYKESTVLSGIDQTPSTVTVTNPTTNPEQEKVVSATDTDLETTTWTYKQIAGSANCDAGQMSRGSQSYEEGSEVNLNSEEQNGKKICFSVIDSVGNITYEASEVISGIDTTDPTIAVTSPNSGPAQEKMIEADDTDTEATTWTYKQIASSASCNATQMISGTQPYTEGTGILFNRESDNGTKICFSATDLAGNTGYERSGVLRGIDTTAPTITIHNPDVSIVSNNKKVSATDGEEVSQWAYQQIGEDVACDITTTTATKVYTEGTDLAFNKESDNDTKVCFIATDIAGNIATLASVALKNIKEDALTITITTNPWFDFDQRDDGTITRAQAKAVVGMDASDIPSTWFYKQIAGDAICNAEVRNSEDIISYTEGEPIILREESDNGTKICFISIDRDGEITATASEVITGIDTTMPTIIITETEKTVNARDTDATVSTWAYKRITGDAICDADQMTNGAETYTEEEQLPLDAEQHNGTKVCFSVTDEAGNTSFKASETLSMISTTISNWTDPATISDATITHAQAKAVIGTDGNNTRDHMVLQANCRRCYL